MGCDHVTEADDKHAMLRARLAKAPSPGAEVDVLRAHLLRRARAKSPSWIDELADLADECDLSPRVLRGTISTLAWQARDVGQPMPTVSVEESGPVGTRELCRRYLLGFRLRFDFRFDALSAQVRTWLRADPEDALLLAMSGFAGLGQQSSRALRDIDASLASPNADYVTTIFCLHGLWFGNDVDGQAERIEALSDELISRGEIEPNVFFWRAYAFRRMERFDEARESIDRAIELLAPGNNTIHQDYVRERALITTSKVLVAQVATQARQVSAELREEMSTQLEAAKAELRAQQEDAQKAVSDSLLKIVEILGLFIALAGFLVGSGIVAFRAAGFWQNFASMALVLVGSLLFFGLLRLTIRFRPRRRRGSRAAVRP
jgi:hypothetical protein